MLYVDTLLRLTQRMRSQGEYARAIEFAQKVLASDAANERAHQHLMFCYLASGKRDAALRQFFCG
jgi:DNA-binding SARP family transcriptional activator